MDGDNHVLIDHEGLRLTAQPDAGGGNDAGATQAPATASWRGTPLLARYAWRWWGADGAVSSDRCRVRRDGADFSVVWTDARGRTALELRRRLRPRRYGWSDELELVNPGASRLALSIELDAAAADPVASELVMAGALHLATGGSTARLTFDALAAARPDGADWEVSLAPGERVQLFAELCLAVN